MTDPSGSRTLAGMSPDPARAFDGKKFMWDGLTYGTREEAEKRCEALRAEGFEVRLAEQDGKHLVYTRRVVKQTAATT